MTYTDKYGFYLNGIPQLIEKAGKSGCSPVFAFTSNLDVVLKWDAEAFNRILDRYLTEEPVVRKGDRIDSMKDFARISSWYVQRGLGGNYNITDVGVCNFLKEQFSTEFSLGGTCAQGAAAIGTLGMPVSVALTDRCSEVMKMLDHPGTTIVKGKELIPVREDISGKDPVYHFILQFNKDDEIRICGKNYTIPQSNRLILFYDDVHSIVPIDSCFLRYWEAPEHPSSSYLLSGFDAILDQQVMAERLAELEPHLKRMKATHPDTVIYFEGAFYMNPAVKEQVSAVFSRYADILGMNEEELTEQLDRFGRSADLGIAENVTASLRFLLSRYQVRGIILHTKDYSMYYGKELSGIDIEEGLTMGNLMSGTRARLGRYGTQEDLKGTLELPLSRTGLAFAEQAEKTGGDMQIKVVPSRYLEHPKYTIGLGDTFVSGVHTCFIR